MQLLFSTVQALVLDWEISWVQNVNPDGLSTRRAVGVNGKWPIAPVIVKRTDSLVINVVNKLPEPTAIHCHGLFQNGTTYYDGVPGTTQCSIPSNAKMTYKIPIQQTGTYWIHGHNLGHYVDGLRAPLIIKDDHEKKTYKYHDEHIITLSDWYHKEHNPLLQEYLNPANPDGFEPVPNSALINEGRPTDLYLEPGKTYRLRVIGMSAFASFNFWIDGHEMTLIEIDGVLVKPSLVQSLTVASSQRYSVLVTAKRDSKFNYNINAAFMLDMFYDETLVNRTLATGKIVYCDHLPLFNASQIPIPDPNLFDDTKFSPVEVISSAVPDVSYTLNVTFEVYNDRINHGAFNQVVYKQPLVPSLFTAVSMGRQNTFQDVYGRWTNPIILKHLDYVEVVINNYDGGSHPFHLHGHVFQVVARGMLTDPPYVSNSTINSLSNPLRRDAVVVQAGGYVVIRFRADNPGAYLLHCHIEWHLQAGLAALFIEAPERVRKWKIPKQVLDTCSAQNVPISGNADGGRCTSDINQDLLLPISQ